MYRTHCNYLYNKVISGVPLNETRTSSWISWQRDPTRKNNKTFVANFLVMQTRSVFSVNWTCPRTEIALVRYSGLTPHKLLSSLSVCGHIVNCSNICEGRTCFWIAGSLYFNDTTSMKAKYLWSFRFQCHYLPLQHCGLL